MEAQSNFNPAPVKLSFWRRHGRTTAFVVVGIAAALAVLVYIVGVSKLARIIGIQASTTTTVDFFGADNLTGGPAATDTHVVQTTSAVLNNVQILTTQAGVPDADPAGEIVPDYQGDVSTPEQTPSSQRFYISPALDLTNTTNTLDDVRTRAFIADQYTNLTFNYRTAATIADLDTAQFLPIETTFTPAYTPEGDTPTISDSNTPISAPILQYIQFQATFSGGINNGIKNTIPSAVYGWSFDYTDVPPVVTDGSGGGSGDTGTIGGDTNTGTGSATDGLLRNITLNYERVASSVPSKAKITLVPADKDLPEQVVATEEDMTKHDIFAFSTTIPAGAYAIVVTSSDYSTGVVPFLVGGGSDYDLHMGALTAATTCPASQTPANTQQYSSADFNHDGVVNSVDYVYFLSQYGMPTP